MHKHGAALCIIMPKTNCLKICLSQCSKMQMVLYISKLFLDQLLASLRIKRRNCEELELPATCSLLERPDGSKLYLIGTAHFSKESCLDVQKVLFFNYSCDCNHMLSTCVVILKSTL